MLRVSFFPVFQYFVTYVYIICTCTTHAMRHGIVLSAMDSSTSAMDSSALNSSAMDSSAMDSSALNSSAMDSSAMDSSALNSSAMDSSAMESSAMDSAVLSLVHKVTLGLAFRCVTRSSGVCERDYTKPQLPLAPAEAPLAIGQKSISA